MFFNPSLTFGSSSYGYMKTPAHRLLSFLTLTTTTTSWLRFAHLLIYLLKNGYLAQVYTLISHLITWKIQNAQNTLSIYWAKPNKSTSNYVIIISQVRGMYGIYFTEARRHELSAPRAECNKCHTFWVCNFISRRHSYHEYVCSEDKNLMKEETSVPHMK